MDFSTRYNILRSERDSTIAKADKKFNDGILELLGEADGYRREKQPEPPPVEVTFDPKDSVIQVLRKTALAYRSYEMSADEILTACARSGCNWTRGSYAVALNQAGPYRGQATGWVKVSHGRYRAVGMTAPAASRSQ